MSLSNRSRPRRRSVRAVALGLVAVVVATSCAARNKVEGAEGEQESTGAPEESTNPSADTFGEIESPCGKGDYSVEAAEAAGSPDVLRLGVASDRSSQIRPGLNKELWDTSVAFAEWCNEQGGIGGLQIELVDLDGKLLDVQTAMAKACKGVFMMVGGGFVQDDLEFSGKEGSDFHKCGLAAIPGFTTSPQKAESNGQVQPVPHPASESTSLWLRDFAKLHPKEAESMAIVWGDLPSMETIRNQAVAVVKGEGAKLAGDFSYLPTGESDWTPLAQKVVRSGAGSMHWVGEPTNLGSYVKALREQGWKGYPVLETNVYDAVFVESAGVDAAEGSIVRSVFHPFEEADKWPAVKQYVDIMEQHSGGGKVAVLGMQSFSAWLLFATAANDCAADNDGVLTRACVLIAADAIDDWTGGGLHGPTDPGPEGGPSPECAMLLTVNEDGAFERLFPEIGSADDVVDGFSCADDAVVEVPANEGKGVIGENQPL